jgi:hypothetical protein
MDVSRHLLSIPNSQRPRFAFWLTESPPPQSWPKWLVRVGSEMRIGADRILGVAGGQKKTNWKRFLLRGHRLRIVGELRWAKNRGLLNVLAVTCASRASYYRHWDIDVAFLGNPMASRRRHVLSNLIAQLRNRNIHVEVKTGLYGLERTYFLNRVQIFLNILRLPHDYTGQRFLLGAANKALVISESAVDFGPFIPGNHLVSAPLDQLADTIEAYLKDDKRRLEIVNEAYQFVTGELHINNIVRRILDASRKERNINM